MATTAYYTSADCWRHDMGEGHPECPQRLSAIEDQLLMAGLEVALRRQDAPLAQTRDLLLAHHPSYVAEVTALMQQVADSGQSRYVDPDTMVSPGTWAAAMRAVGAAVAATDAVINAQVSNAFCAVRPPGHHATRNESMGFCFFNQVAIAARHALDVRGLERVLVVDFDVHHGNGTEDILAGDDRVLMVSFFQHPLYPNSGTTPRGDNMVNVPLPPYAGGERMREVVETRWAPRVDRFAPQMIFVSAGFDAHRDDDMGQLGLVEADYVWLTNRLMRWARRDCAGRIVSCLEGGYHLGALARSVVAHLRVLADVPD